MTNAAVEKLISAAIDKAQASDSLDDIQKAVQICESNVKAEQALAEIHNQRKKFRLESFQSAGSLLVPLVSLLALLGTIWTQSDQLRVAREQAQRQFEEQRQERVDDEWRDFVKSVPSYAKDNFSDPSFVPQLQFFITRTTYTKEALGISKGVMGSLANETAFKQLFALTFPAGRPGDLNDILDVLRFNSRAIEDAYDECRRLSAEAQSKLETEVPEYGYCAASLFTDQAVELAIKGRSQGRRIEELRRNSFFLWQEQSFLSQQVANRLPTVFNTGPSASHKSIEPIDFHDLTLQEVSMANIDFTNFDMTNTVLDSVNLTGARLTPAKTWNSPDIRASNWWKARAISKNILLRLIDVEYPYYPNQGSTDYPATYAQYVQDVTALCRPYKNACPSTLKFGSPPPAEN